MHRTARDYFMRYLSHSFTKTIKELNTFNTNTLSVLLIIITCFDSNVSFSDNPLRYKSVAIINTQTIYLC